MGWLFSERWLERKDLIKHLVEGNGLKTLKHCTVGNNLWCVHEIKYGNNLIKFICLYKMQGPTRNKNYSGMDKDWWGYKDIDESMGPVELSCPVSYLEMCTAPEGMYAYEWRQRVYARGRKLRAAVPGAKFRSPERIYTITKRRSPSSWYAKCNNGMAWRLGARYLSQLELIKVNFKPAFILPGEEKPCTNAQVFATYEEAVNSAAARFQVWTMPSGYTVVETEDPVNYEWLPNVGDMPIRAGETA